MSVHSKIDVFDPAVEDWSTHIERLQHYFVANDITTEVKKQAVLLTVCGLETYSLACHLVAPAKPGDKPFEEPVTAIKKHYSPQPSIIIQHFKFHSRYHKQGESIACYIADLRQIAKFCEFKDALNDMLRDRLVCGVNDRAIQ